MSGGKVYYVLINMRYIRLLGSGAWATTQYRSNATTFETHQAAAKYAEKLTYKGYEATVSGPQAEVQRRQM